MLDQPDRDLRELLHLGTHRLPDRHALCLGEQVPAIARVRPMLDDFIRHRRRQQIPATPLMPILSALFAPGGSLRRLSVLPGLSVLGGREEFLEFAANSASNTAIRSP